MSRVKIVIDRVPGVMKAIDGLGSQRVMVGVPSTTAGRTTDDEGNKLPITNAALGYVHENGVPELNIPARPFLIPGVQSAQSEIVARLKQAGRYALDGKPDAAQKALAAVGQVGANAVQAKITDGPFVPLAPATLAARKARGRTGDRPLIDTGQLRRSITWVLRKAKK